MNSKHPRLQREAKTITAMIQIYCSGQHHSPDQLCPECRELLEYANARLVRCPFQENKPTCANCTVHCYKPAMRERVRVMMRYAGPRMLWKHPYLAIMHLWVDSRRKPPVLKRTTSRE